MREYCQYFCDVITEHYHIVAKYSPSKVAMACFYMARKCCQLRTVWGEDLTEYTTYTVHSLSDILQEFEETKELRALVTYALNNFKEGASVQKFKQHKDVK